MKIDMCKKFDIIIPVALNEALFVTKALPYLRKNLMGAERIFLITNNRNFRFLREEPKKDSKCVLIDENALVEGLNFSVVKALLQEKYNGLLQPRTGWYFQQFLKMGFALSQYASDYYLSWDADTLPLSPISFFDGSHILYNPKREFHQPYFDTLKKLLGIDRGVDHSYIAEHMMFSVDIMREMVSDISNTSVPGDNWVQKIINSTDISMSKSCEMFSEFETYGNYCALKYPGLYKPRHLNTFREAGFINGRFLNESRLKTMSFDLDTASFELHHSPPFPQKLIHRLYCIYLRLMKFYVDYV